MNRSPSMLSFLLAFTYGCAPNYKVDGQSGILIRRDRPENTVGSFYFLQEMGSFKEAHQLLDKASQEEFSPFDLKYFWDSAKDEPFFLRSLSSAKKGAFATVLYVKGVEKLGRNKVLVGIEVLKKEEDSWSIIKTSQQYKEEEMLEICDLLIEVENRAFGVELTDFTDEEQALIKEQIIAFKIKQENYREKFKSQNE